MNKNILVIAAITSASFAIINLGSPRPSVEEGSTSTVALETLSQAKGTSSKEEGKDQTGYEGTNEDGEREEVTTSS